VRVSRGAVLGYGTMTLVALLAVLLWAFDGPGGRRAVLASAGIALLVQAVAFTLERLAAPGKMFKAWGAGSALRFVTLVVYALVLIKPLGLPAVPALISLAALFFVTTVLESLLLTS
jgi:hypothetical protein